MCAQLPHDFRRQVPVRFSRFGFGGHVRLPDGEVLAQSGGEPAGAGQSHRPDAGEHRADLAAGPDPGVAADLSDRFEVGQPVQERLHVGSPQHRWVFAAVGTHAQRLRQPHQAADVVTHRQASAGAPPRSDASFGQVVGRPPLGGLPQPGLADAGKRHRAVMPEHRQVPFVLGDFGFRGRQGAAGVTDQAVGQPGELQAAAVADDIVGDRAHLLGQQVVAERAQQGLVGLDRVDPAALLQAHQQFGDHQRRQATQTNLPAATDRRLGCPPMGFIQMRVACAGGAQPLLVRPAVEPVGMTALAGAGGDRARRARRKRAGLPVSKELVDIGNRQGAQLFCVGATQPGTRRFPLASTTVHDTGIRSAPRSFATPRGKRGDLVVTEPVFGEPTAARGADPRRCRRGCRTARRAADRASQQRMLRRERQHRTRRVPAGLGEERGIDHQGDRRSVPIDPCVGEHVRPAGDDRARRHRLGAHRSVPASSRGLGTRSTASRSRAGSGCR